MPLKVPNKINRKVRLIAEKISTNPIIEFIQVKVEPFSIIKECHLNIQKKVEHDGGDIVYGWQIWQDSFFIEAEFHSIWRSPEGLLIDITPKENNEDKILFIHDHINKYTGYQYDNIRVNTSGNPIVDDYLNIYKTIYQLSNYGENKFKTGVIELTGVDAQNYNFLEYMKGELSLLIINEISDLSVECFCQNQKPYFLCHREKLLDIINKISRKYNNK